MTSGQSIKQKCVKNGNKVKYANSKINVHLPTAIKSLKGVKISTKSTRLNLAQSLALQVIVLMGIGVNLNMKDL
jgi:hypothetical protein